MHDSWKNFLNCEFTKPYFLDLSTFLREEYSQKTIFPEKKQVFRAFTTDLNKVSVVILGQDPYHTPGAAHGLAFSVPDTEPIPPSLKNIYKEIDTEFGHHENKTGNLKSWQEQGVLLLNNTLTVEAHKAGSHRGHGWEQFTEATIKHLSHSRTHLVFMLWGNDAQSKASLIDNTKHLVLKSPHPSPFSAHKGFFGNNHFKEANNYLKECGLPEIKW